MVCYCWLVAYYAHLFIMTTVHFAHLCVYCYYNRRVRCARTSYVGANNIIRTKNLSLSCPPKFLRLEPPLVCINLVLFSDLYIKYLAMVLLNVTFVNYFMLPSSI